MVVKASGLAAGKGVIVASNKLEACQAVDDILTDKKFGQAGSTVVIEELLTGEEVSVGLPLKFFVRQNYTKNLGTGLLRRNHHQTDVASSRP